MNVTKLLPVTNVAWAPGQAHEPLNGCSVHWGQPAGCERKNNVWALVAWHSRGNGPEGPRPARPFLIKPWQPLGRAGVWNMSLGVF